MSTYHRRSLRNSSSEHERFLTEIAPQESLVYVDETFQQSTKQFPDSFYSMCGVVLQGSYIFEMQDGLRDLVGDTYWHATEALRDGREQVFLSILDYMRQHPTMNVIVTTIDIADPSEKALEMARQQTLSRLLISLSNADVAFRGAIMEQRNSRKKNNSDAALVSRLRSNGDIPSSTAFKIISPNIDSNLWLPDTAAMAYRRTITHHEHATSQWFAEYLAKFSHVTTLPDNGRNPDPRVLSLWIEQMKQIQDDPNAAEHRMHTAQDDSSLAFLQKKRNQIPLTQLIEQQLRSTRVENESGVATTEALEKTERKDSSCMKARKNTT